MKDPATYKLNVDAVRRRASSITGVKELPRLPQANPALCSFLVGLENDRSNKAKLARVNVFCDTGTVGVSRILLGEVRQTFRRHVHSLDTVERFLRDAPTLTQIDQSLVGLDDDMPSLSSSNHNRKNATTIRGTASDLELAEVGVAVLQGERDKLSAHLDALRSASNGSVSTTAKMQPSPGNKSEADQSESSSAGLSGMEFQFSLSPDNMKHVDRVLREINQMNKLVKGVATNGRGSVFLYGNGGVAYTPNIPKALYQKLSQLRKSAYNHRPCYVSLGTRDRYFVAFYDSTFAFKGPKALDKELKKITKPPLSVAFGSTYDTFFIVFHDGSYAYQGRGLPAELLSKLKDRSYATDVLCVNLGPDGEWFLRAGTRGGKLWWGGISIEMDTAIAELLDAGHFLNYLDFGEDGSYFISYD